LFAKTQITYYMCVKNSINMVFFGFLFVGP
jgi:hypothetical protein